MIPKEPFYHKGWFILIMFMLAPFTLLITGIIGAVLLLTKRDDRYREYYYRVLSQYNAIIQHAKVQANNIIDQANKEYNRIVEVANLEQAKVDKAQRRLEEEKSKTSAAKTIAQSQKEMLKKQRSEEKELEREIKQAEKTISKAEREIKKLIKYNSLEQIPKLKLEIEQAKVDIDYLSELLHNQTAGYLYILSNIGSLGFGIYKVGVTKNPEPMKAIAELDTTSIPFPYDVHALIYSEYAEEIHEAIREHFKDRMINKVNHEKDFFRIDLDELRDFIYNNFDDSVSFNENIEARQYYESIRGIGINKDII